MEQRDSGGGGRHRDRRRRARRRGLGGAALFLEAASADARKRTASSGRPGVTELIPLLLSGLGCKLV